MKIWGFYSTVCGAAVATGMLFTASQAFAQSAQIRTANVTNVEGASSVTLGGKTFTNKGLTGAGRLDANALDFRNETLGSFSGMAMNLSTWRRNSNGSYTSSIATLPDRGPFDGAIDYRNRVHTHDIAFTPLNGTAILPQLPSSQSQLTITPTGGFTLKDTDGIEMTGRDPGAKTVTRAGIVYPSATDGTAAGHISLDAEAIAFRPDGTFYVSDEYAAGLYYFDATGKQIGAIQTVPALLPRTNGAINFNSTTPGQTGRRNNQGLEAMAITPDNKKLVTILQSATVQDTNGANQQTRSNTRILVYDISANAIPTNPVGHYVLQLPVLNNNGSGGAPDRTAAQSEMLALNDNQFLVLARDSLGRGVAANASTSTTPLFKSVLLVDTTGATNLAGTPYETGTTPIASNGVLIPAIVPVQQVELVNMLNPTQLARVGMNITRLPRTNATTIGEKWEAMALAPVLEENAPQDFFLFVGNDNDFQGTNIRFNGVSSASGALDGTGNNDSILLVYRLTLPTYVDPQALAAMNAMAPDVLYGTRMAMNGLGMTATQPAMRFLNAQRSVGAPEGVRHRAQLWMDGDWSKIGAGASPLTGLDVDTMGTTLGLDVPLGTGVRVGVMGGYRKMDGKLAYGAPLDADAWTVGAYAGASLPMGIYAQISAAWLGDVKFREIGRASAYGQTATGKTKGEGWAVSGEIGWRFPVGRVGVTPFAAVDYTDLDLDGYTESGASVSNIVYADRSFKKATISMGGELSVDIGAIHPAIRGGYSFEQESGDKSAAVRLASAEHSMGSALLSLGDTERDTAFAELRIAMGDGPVSGYVSGRGRWGRGNDDARVTIGVGFAL
ncbi:MAG: esterase-like activity of phytase family protein [Pseudomonadota bacterium]